MGEPNRYAWGRSGFLPAIAQGHPIHPTLIATVMILQSCAGRNAPAPHAAPMAAGTQQTALAPTSTDPVAEPQPEIADRLYALALERIEAGKPAAAELLLFQLINQHPISQPTLPALALLGVLHDHAGEHKEAAGLYEKQFHMDSDYEPHGAPGGLSSQQAIARAAELRERTGDLGAAIQNHHQYVSTWPHHAAIPTRLIRVGGLYERQGQWRRAALVYRSCFAVPPSEGRAGDVAAARLGAARVLLEMGDAEGFRRHRAESLEVLSRSAAELGDAGRAALVALQGMQAPVESAGTDRGGGP